MTSLVCMLSVSLCVFWLGACSNAAVGMLPARAPTPTNHAPTAARAPTPTNHAPTAARALGPTPRADATVGVTPMPLPTAAATAPPRQPRPPEAQRFSDTALGFSFSYPPNFVILPRAPDAPPGVTLTSPPFGTGVEPIIFAMHVEFEPTQETAVKKIVDAEVAQLPESARTAVKRRALTVDGEAAEEVRGLASRAGDVETLVVHEQTLYRIILEPYDPSAKALAPYLDLMLEAYQLMLASFEFLE